VAEVGDVRSGDGLAEEHGLGPDDVTEDVAHGPAGQARRHVPLCVVEASAEFSQVLELGTQQIDGGRLVQECRHEATVAAGDWLYWTTSQGRMS
jgi:hypothetical protein